MKSQVRENDISVPDIKKMFQAVFVILLIFIREDNTLLQKRKKNTSVSITHDLDVRF